MNLATILILCCLATGCAVARQPSPVSQQAEVSTAAVSEAIAPSPAPLDLLWDYPEYGLHDVVFEMSRTDDLIMWQVWTNIAGTNRVPMPMDGAQSFFVITKVFRSYNTNEAIYWDRKGIP